MHDLIKNRRSCRSFKDSPVPKEKIDQIIDAGLWAASGMGKQSPVIIAVTNREMRDHISRVNAEIMGTDTDPFYGAPVILLVIADRSVPTCVYDGSLVMGNMMLEAENQGLASCWIHRAKQEFDGELGKMLSERLGLSGDYEGIGHLALGFADASPAKPAPRKDNRSFYIE